MRLRSQTFLLEDLIFKLQIFPLEHFISFFLKLMFQMFIFTHPSTPETTHVYEDNSHVSLWSVNGKTFVYNLFKVWRRDKKQSHQPSIVGQQTPKTWQSWWGQWSADIAGSNFDTWWYQTSHLRWPVPPAVRKFWSWITRFIRNCSFARTKFWWIPVRESSKNCWHSKLFTFTSLIFIKVWILKVWVLSNVNQTLTLKVWVLSNFDFQKSEIYQSLTFTSLSFVKFWLLNVWVLSHFDFQKSEFHQSLIKLWLLKVWVLSKFDETQTLKVWVLSQFDETQTLKVWVLSKFDFWKSEFCQSLTFKSLSFVKVWLSKVWLLWNFDEKSNFDKTQTFCIKLWQNSDFWMPNFDKTQTFNSQTLTKLRLLKVKLWQNSDFQKSNFDKTQTFKVWVSSNFDKIQTFKSQRLIKLWWNSDFWKSKFDTTQTLKSQSLIKPWQNSDFQNSNFDKTQTFKSQNLIKLW